MGENIMKSLLLLGLVVAILLIAGCTGSTDTQSITTNEQNVQGQQNRQQNPAGAQVAMYTDDNIIPVFSNPEQFKGSTVDITGQIFTIPEVSGNKIGFQMYQGGVFNLQKNTAVIYEGTLSFQPVSDDCVRVRGSVDGKFEGKNAFGGNVEALLIKASSIEKIECKEVVSKTKKTVIVSKSETKYKVNLTLEKVEFADEETRVYLNLHNGAGDKIYFYTFNSMAFQDDKQFKTAYAFGSNYPEIDSEIFSGVTEQGIVVFEPMDYAKTNAKFRFEITIASSYYTVPFNFNVTIL